MMAGGGGLAVAGGPARHVPVLVRQAVQQLKLHDGGVYVDGTFGAGGYARAILAAAPTAQVIGIDRDRTAIAHGAELVEAAGGRLTLIEARFSEIAAVVRKFGHAVVDGIVLDLGVSSMQLDQPERGFSFRHDAPLDMRMSADGPSAADVVARAPERDLADIVFRLGEERHARAVARAIVAARQRAPIASTVALADIVAGVVRHRPGTIHPATRTFQALRMFVNEELAELVAALEGAEHVLRPGGRLAVVAFHSLEDRIVKTFLAERSRAAAISRHRPDIDGPAPTFRILTKRPIVPDPAEVEQNPRARSAKLRAAERTAGPARNESATHLLPQLPSLAAAIGRA
jgi:16S rRNA (cytosine1402-N4)-methyltransferase